MSTIQTSLRSQLPLTLQRVVLTGAAGVLGRLLLPVLHGGGYQVRYSDRMALPGAPSPGQWGGGGPGCDLADAPKVLKLLEGADAVVHLGGVSVESPFEPLLAANFQGTHNLYEAARLQRVRRVVFASSNHVVGCYPQGQRVDLNDTTRPDGNYGLSKLFGEGLASLYWHRYGLESVSLRIGSATPAPQDRRALSTWISPADLSELVLCSLRAPNVGNLVAFGVSANTRRWWFCDEAWERLGYSPKDNAERHAADVEHLLLPAGPQREMQGGSFLGLGPFA
jgi:uronate dehydrogenase